MWATPALMCLCLGLVTSAPTIEDFQDENALLEEASPAGQTPDDFESIPDFNMTAADDEDYAMLTDLLKDMLGDYDAAAGDGDASNTNSSLNGDTLEGMLTSQDGTESENSHSEEAFVSDNTQSTSDPSTSKGTTAAREQSPAAEGDTSENQILPSLAENPSISASSPSSSPSSSSSSSSSFPSSSSSSSSSSPSSSADDYDYYDYSDVYADYTPPTAFPFSMFSDVDPRPPTKGDVLPSSCAWAVVQCCGNPDKMVSTLGTRMI